MTIPEAGLDRIYAATRTPRRWRWFLEICSRPVPRRGLDRASRRATDALIRAGLASIDGLDGPPVLRPTHAGRVLHEAALALYFGDRSETSNT